MTSFEALGEKEKRFPARALSGRICFLLLSLLCFVLLLLNADTVSDAVRSSLAACGQTVIPALFPIAVLSELVLSVAQEALPSAILAPLGKVLRLRTEGCYAVLLGWICGFPVGARCVKSAYLAGYLEKAEAERALSFCNTPSAAFLINAVGLSLYGTRAFGIALYASVLTSSLVCGVCISHLSAKKGTLPSRKVPRQRRREIPLARLFTESVKSAAGSIFIVCAYIIFFSAFSGALRPLLLSLGAPHSARAALLSLLEISVGTRECAALSSQTFSGVMTAFAAGWSGISVHCQLLSLCDGTDLSLRSYLPCKLLQGILSALFLGALLMILPNLL